MPDELYWQSFFNPDCIVSRLDCTSSGDVVEFGSGYGLFTVPAAKRTSGTVYALDIDPQMIAATKTRAESAGLENVVALERDFLADGCGRPDGTVGYAMLFNILHIEEPVELLKVAFRALEPGGRLGIVHWRHDSATPRGPSLTIRPQPEECRGWAEAAGFRFVRNEDLCCCSWHWGMVLERPNDLRPAVDTI